MELWKKILEKEKDLKKAFFSRICILIYIFYLGAACRAPIWRKTLLTRWLNTVLCKFMNIYLVFAFVSMGFSVFPLLGIIGFPKFQCFLTSGTFYLGCAITFCGTCYAFNFFSCFFLDNGYLFFIHIVGHIMLFFLCIFFSVQFFRNIIWIWVFF